MRWAKSVKCETPCKRFIHDVVALPLDWSIVSRKGMVQCEVIAVWQITVTCFIKDAIAKDGKTKRGWLDREGNIIEGPDPDDGDDGDGDPGSRD